MSHATVGTLDICVSRQQHLTAKHLVNFTYAIDMMRALLTNFSCVPRMKVGEWFAFRGYTFVLKCCILIKGGASRL